VSSSDDFDVVVICSGNRFRSPIAEAVLRRQAEGQGLPVRVRSFGTMDLPSGHALPEALELAPGYGLDLMSHRSSPLAGQDLSGADLVIGFEQIHVSTAVVGAGAQRERTFLITELLAGLDESALPQNDGVVERARAAVRQADAARRAAPGIPQEIADPIGGPAAGYRRTADEVYRLTTRVAERLFG
jgi:low molecular weight protein-tyrosine phosphatase